MQNVYMGLDVEEFIFGEGTTYEESYDVSNEEMNALCAILGDKTKVKCYFVQETHPFYITNRD